MVELARRADESDVFSHNRNNATPLQASSWSALSLIPRIDTVSAPAAALLFVELLLAGWAESKRLADYNNPGSQGDGSFFGITDGLKGLSNGYPGALCGNIALAAAAWRCCSREGTEITCA